MPNKSRTRGYRIPGESGANERDYEAKSTPPPLGETTAYGVGDRVQCAISNRIGVVQLSYINDRNVLYSIQWDDGLRTPKKASEIRLIQRKV